MINIFNIFKKNRNTFYDYSTGVKTSLVKQLIIKSILAIIMTSLFFHIKHDVFSIVITIYSILIGFSFSVLFFLMSINLEIIDTEKNLEIKRIKKKLNKLLEELFYNVSYFNLLSVCLIFLSLVIFIFSGLSEWIATFKDNYIPKSYDELLATITFILLSLD